MDFFRKKPVAVAVLVLAVIAAAAIGQIRKPPDRSDTPIPSFVCVDDRAGLLNGETERYITSMNESLFYQCGGMVFAATVDSTGRTDIFDFAEDLGAQYGVGSQERDNGIVILLAPGNVSESGLQGDYCVALGTGLERYEDTLNDLIYEMEDDFAAGRYDRAVRTAFDAYIRWFEGHYDIQVREGYLPQDAYQDTSAGGSPVLGTLIVLLVIILLLWVIFDGIRYSSYRRRYRSYPVPPVIYRPVFWGRPRRRPLPPPSHHRPPPPPRPPRGGHSSPPAGGGFHQGGSFGGSGASRGSGSSFGGSGASRSGSSSSRSSGGFSRSSGPSKSSGGGFSRGGSFGGFRSSGSRSSGSRSGASRSGGASRGGGGSRGGRR